MWEIRLQKKRTYIKKTHQKQPNERWNQKLIVEQKTDL